jgi:hypothetical protein
MTSALTANPWFSIWTRPRATIRRIVDEDPERAVLVLAGMGGFAQMLNRASSRSLGDDLPVSGIFLVAAIAGPVVGIASLYVAGWLLKLAGDGIGGRGSVVDIRAALAWSNVPIIWALILVALELALLGEELFTTATPRLDESPMLVLGFLGLALIELIIGIWALVIFLKCLGEVQGFSAWKALGSVLIVVIGVAFVVVATGILLLFLASLF